MYFEWLKERIKQMSVPRKRKVMPSGFVKPAETVSFETAAGTSNVAPLPVDEPVVNKCNRHSDCDEADRDTKLGHPERWWGADHCHDDCCEECFGY